MWAVCRLVSTGVSWLAAQEPQLDGKRQSATCMCPGKAQPQQLPATAPPPRRAFVIACCARCLLRGARRVSSRACCSPAGYVPCCQGSILPIPGSLCGAVRSDHG